MNILFLTLLDFNSLTERNIYTDLLREFVKSGHYVCSVSPVERRKNTKTHLVKESGGCILKLRIGNTQKTNVIEKGISTLLIEPQFINGIKKHFSDIKFDLVLYSTPPITFCNAIEFVKKRDAAKSYLLLKDIFPQNAVDLGMMSKSGIKGIIYKYFRNKEKKLYAISDKIGCMSPANLEYVLRENPEISHEKVEVSPNCIEVTDRSIDEKTKLEIREKYGIPTEKTVFVYGGNLGKPQGIPHLIRCLETQLDKTDRIFLIIGSGTESEKLESFMRNTNALNVKLMPFLPKEEFDLVVSACDVGMIFLDPRFTIPNFPSRLLSYMQAKLPVLACTDKNTDIGKVITENNFGWWCESDNAESFVRITDEIVTADIEEMKNREFEFLCENYSADRCSGAIIEAISIVDR